LNVFLIVLKCPKREERHGGIFSELEALEYERKEME
jgi:hypothetical protein